MVAWWKYDPYMSYSWDALMRFGWMDESGQLRLFV